MTEIHEILSRFAGRLSQSSDPVARNAAQQCLTDLQRLQKQQKAEFQREKVEKAPLLEQNGHRT